MIWRLVWSVALTGVTFAGVMAASMFGAWLREYWVASFGVVLTVWAIFFFMLEE